jgi:hypothetical protein
MDVTPINLKTVHFDEHPFCDPDTHPGSEFEITLTPPYSDDSYSQALFKYINTVGLSEVALFLHYQCSQVEHPLRWLNSLEKLIKLNAGRFDTSELGHRHVKLTMEIGLMRHTLLSPSDQVIKKNKKLNAYTDENEYSFPEVKIHLKTFKYTEEKIAYLRDQIFNYRQNPPDYIPSKTPTFDLQCEIEIERLEIQQEYQEKINQKKNAEKKGAKLPFNGDLKVLCNVYYQLMTMQVPNGTTFLPWTITQTTNFICNNFCHHDGYSINPATVRTYLSSSKPDSRPKANSQIKL